MPSHPSPSSSVQRARSELAARLRDLRLDAGLTARALSRAAGWHEAKTSRIENAKQPPSDADITAWCRVCEMPGEAPDLIAANRAADSAYVSWRRLHRTGMARDQESRVPLYERTRHHKVYCSTVVPGFFQTPAYAHALMSSITRFQGTPDDVDVAVEARMERNHVLQRGGRRFAAIIEESVLRARHGDAEAMAAQLGHLLAMTGLPSVWLGVIPFTAADRPMWTLEAFNIFDDQRVEVELLSAQVTVTAPSEVAAYVRAFSGLAGMAVSGSAARSLITAAIDAL
ncbi:MAG: helix-turn-helix domain-containing protein [Streptosporangiales bacterium]|nr:helix-turn-helix domain-containing protein [Streptosporangiales bacterium]